MYLPNRLLLQGTEKPRGYARVQKGLGLTRGLVGCYPLGAVSGVTVFDATDNHNAGVLNNFSGSGVWTRGSWGGIAPTFDGSSQFIDLGAPPALELYGTLTLSCWVKSASNPGADAFTMAKDFSIGNRGYGIGVNTSGQLYIESAGAPINLGGPVFGNTNQWTHLLATKDNSGSDNWTGYVNGVNIGTGNNGFGLLVNPNSLAHWYLSGRQYAGFFNGFAGAIDLACLWNRQPTNAEAYSIYRNQLSIFEPTTVDVDSNQGVAPGFTAVNRRTLGPRVGSRSVH